MVAAEAQEGAALKDVNRRSPLAGRRSLIMGAVQNSLSVGRVKSGRWAGIRGRSTCNLTCGQQCRPSGRGERGEARRSKGKHLERGIDRAPRHPR